jgi:serine/threonine protein kinase
VWAFGNLVFKMLFGEYPFDNPNVNNTLSKGIYRLSKLRLITINALHLIKYCLLESVRDRLTFKQMQTHPFFTEKEKTPYFKLFDVSLGFVEMNIHRLTEPFLPRDLYSFEPEKQSVFDLHNKDVFQGYLKS